MLSNCHTQISLDKVRQNALAIIERTGVDLLAVLKTDAYGLGAEAVAATIGDLVSGWYVFHPREAILARLSEISDKPTIAAVPLPRDDARLLARHRIRPGVWTTQDAKTYRSIDPVLSVDTGMQRFACAAHDIDAILATAPQIKEAFTHASRPEHAERLRSLLANRGFRLHAAGTVLLENPACRLDAVRVGLGLYRDAVRVSAALFEVHNSAGPLGYSGTQVERHGVILAGYSHGLREGPCLVNGRQQRIIEVGMNSAYVTLSPTDRAGDEVVLLGDGLAPEEIASDWRATAHEVLLRLTRLGIRSYTPPFQQREPLPAATLHH
jgi:alanine racemase